MDKPITAAVDHIKQMTGITVELCTYFTWLTDYNDSKYFNIEVSDRYNDRTVNAIERIAGQDKTIKSIEPNGVTRWAVMI